MTKNEETKIKNGRDLKEKYKNRQIDPINNFDEYKTQKGEKRENFDPLSEDFVKANLAKYLINNKFDIIQIAWGRSKGTDIIAYNKKAKKFLNIEAKGISLNDDSITPEGNNFYECIGQAVANLRKNEDIALAFPYRKSTGENDNDYKKHYNVYGDKTNSLNKEIFKRLKLTIYFVDKDGKIIIINKKRNSIPVDPFPRQKKD